MDNHHGEDEFPFSQHLLTPLTEAQYFIIHTISFITELKKMTVTVKFKASSGKINIQKSQKTLYGEEGLIFKTTKKLQ